MKSHTPMYQLPIHHSNPKACGSDLRSRNCLKPDETGSVTSSFDSKDFAHESRIQSRLIGCNAYGNDRRA